MCVRMDKGVHNLYTYTHLGLSSMSVDTHMRTTHVLILHQGLM